MVNPGLPQKAAQKVWRVHCLICPNWNNMLAAGKVPELKGLNFFSQIFIIS